MKGNIVKEKRKNTDEKNALAWVSQLWLTILQLVIIVIAILCYAFTQDAKAVVSTENAIVFFSFVLLFLINFWSLICTIEQSSPEEENKVARQDDEVPKTFAELMKGQNQQDPLHVDPLRPGDSRYDSFDPNLFKDLQDMFEKRDEQERKRPRGLISFNVDLEGNVEEEDEK